MKCALSQLGRGRAFKVPQSQGDLTLSLLCNAVPKREHLWFGKTTQKTRAVGIVLVAENILGLSGRGNLERKQFWLRA